MRFQPTLKNELYREYTSYHYPAIESAWFLQRPCICSGKKYSQVVTLPSTYNLNIILPWLFQWQKTCASRSWILLTYYFTICFEMWDWSVFSSQSPKRDLITELVRKAIAVVSQDTVCSINRFSIILDTVIWRYRSPRDEFSKSHSIKQASLIYVLHRHKMIVIVHVVKLNTL